MVKGVVRTTGICVSSKFLQIIIPFIFYYLILVEIVNSQALASFCWFTGKFWQSVDVTDGAGACLIGK